jgi:hypothetical protein
MSGRRTRRTPNYLSDFVCEMEDEEDGTMDDNDIDYEDLPKEKLESSKKEEEKETTEAESVNTNPVFEYLTKNHGWVRMPEELSKILLTAHDKQVKNVDLKYSQSLSSSSSFSSSSSSSSTAVMRTYRYDFVKMTQTNLESKHVRNIRILRTTV